VNTGNTAIRSRKAWISCSRSFGFDGNIITHAARTTRPAPYFTFCRLCLRISARLSSSPFSIEAPPRTSRTDRRPARSARGKTAIQSGSALYTDALQSYDGLAQEYAHGVINMLKSMLTARSTRTALKILVAPETEHQRNLHQHRAISSVPLSGRASVSLQQSKAE
jgi:hypothetical protein